MKVTIHYPTQASREVDVWEAQVRRHPDSALRKACKMLRLDTRPLAYGRPKSREQHEITSLRHCAGGHTHMTVRGGGDVVIAYKLGDQFDYRNRVPTALPADDARDFIELLTGLGFSERIVKNAAFLAGVDIDTPGQAQSEAERIAALYSKPRDWRNGRSAQADESVVVDTLLPPGVVLRNRYPDITQNGTRFDVTYRSDKPNPVGEQLWLLNEAEKKLKQRELELHKALADAHDMRVQAQQAKNELARQREVNELGQKELEKLRKQNDTRGRKLVELGDRFQRIAGAMKANADEAIAEIYGLNK